MKVPLLDLNAQNLPLEKELTAAFTSVLRSGQFIQGPEVAAFEKEIATMVGATHAIGVSSGTDALVLALMALGIGPGDEVLVPTFTFFATAGCVARTGATPVFVDACPICFNIDTAKAARKITPQTKAIIPVHLFGQSADMDGVMALARTHGLRVIEDGAQSIGARYKNQASGTIGDFGTFSFFPSKNLGGFGDGGMLITQNDALADQARLLRTHGSRPKYFHLEVGGNFRLDPLQAALLRVKLPHYARYTAARQANADAYTSELSRLPGVVIGDPAHCKCLTAQENSLGSSSHPVKIILPVAYAHNEHIWNQYTLRLPEPGQRDALKNHLQARDIGCEIYYPRTMDEQVCFQYTPEASRSDCDVAHRLAAECISLPIYPELPAEHRQEVVAAVASFLS